MFRVPPRWLFVRVETVDGLIGWGEATLEGHTEAVEGAFIDLRERFVGRNADDIQDIWQTAYRARFYRGGPVLMVSPSTIHDCSAANNDCTSERAVWVGYRVMGYQGEEIGRSRVAIARREGPRSRSGIWLDWRR